jgi:cytochrome c oxidase cbb3-type subunit 3
MGRETDEILDHNYDGIQEYDNPLPRWWLGILYGAIVFAFIYVPYYHFGPGALPLTEYDEDMAAWEKLHPTVQLKSAEEIAKMGEDAAFMAAGAEIYKIRCVSCHLADGGGLVGPNFTDDFSIHGQELDKMAKVVWDGVPEKGMIAWKNQLSETEVYQVTLFVASLHGKTPAKPKAAQGDPIGAAN